MTRHFEIDHCDGVDGLKKMDAGTIKLVYGSPPYPNARRDYGVWKSSEYLDRISPFITTSMEKLCKDGFIVINVKANRDAHPSGSSTRSLVVEKLAIKMEEEWGLNCVDIEIWVKSNPIPGGLRVACQDSYEQVLWYSISPKWKLNLDDIRRPYSESSLATYGTHVYRPRRNNLSYVRKAKMIEPNPLGALPINVVEGPISSHNYGHQAVQPGYLPSKYIRACTNEGDLVVDPWLGSGTTGVESLLLKRRFIGFDTSERCIEIAKSRLMEVDYV